MLRTIESFGHRISKNEIVSKEMLSFHNKIFRKKMILVMGAAARKRLESECLLQICKVWLNYASHVKNNRISWSPYIEKSNCFHGAVVLSQQGQQEESDLGHGRNC